MSHPVAACPIGSDEPEDNSLARQMVEAIDEAVNTAQEFDDFNTAVKHQRPDELRKWVTEYDQWFELRGWDREDIECPFRNVTEGACI